METQPLTHREEDLTRYRRQFCALKRSPYLFFPREIQLETISGCNGVCGFCPRTQVSRAVRKMSDALLEKIVSDLEAVPPELPFTVTPFWMNEPFMDGRLIDFLDAVNARLPNARIRLSTNGTLLDKEKLERLCAVRNLMPVTISVNEYAAAAYQDAMGIPFAVLQERLALIHEWKRQGRVPFAVHLSRVASGSGRDEEFGQWVAANYPCFGWYVKTPTNWMGLVPIEVPAVPAVGCVKWFNLAISCEGKVPLCSMDVTGSILLGDVSRENLLTLYRGSLLDQFRLRVSDRRQVSPCDHCSTVIAVQKSAPVENVVPGTV